MCLSHTFFRFLFCIIAAGFLPGDGLFFSFSLLFIENLRIIGMRFFDSIDDRCFVARKNGMCERSKK